MTYGHWLFFCHRLYLSIVSEVDIGIIGGAERKFELWGAAGGLGCVAQRKAGLAQPRRKDT
jgi:hypothetical protein